MEFSNVISLLGIFSLTGGQAIMIVVGLILLYLAINKKFEPLLLVPIGFGAILTNIPEIGLSMSPVEKLIYADIKSELVFLMEALKSPSYEDLLAIIEQPTAEQALIIKNITYNLGYNPGILYTFYSVAIGSGIAPLLIFMGVGAMTDFGPLLANPKTLLLGAAAQFGIFATVIGALVLDHYGLVTFTLKQAAATGIIGGADGPTAIYVSSILAPELLGPIAVAAYSYMALVPLIQPPIMRALTTDAERVIEMKQLRVVSQSEKIVFPITLTILIGLMLPSAAPLLGMFCFGFALVPIYDVFCEITGLNGKVSGPTITQYDENFDSREIKILFVTKNNENMAWNFTSEKRTLDAETGTAYTVDYTFENPTDHPMVAQAIPSVSPGKGAQYFHKTECFCFEEQLLQPGEKLTMPVRFIIDPDLPDDVPVLTLGYTLFDITESHIKLQASN